MILPALLRNYQRSKIHCEASCQLSLPCTVNLTMPPPDEARIVVVSDEAGIEETSFLDNPDVNPESSTTDNGEDEEEGNNLIIKSVPRTRFIYPSACQSDTSDITLIRDPTFGWEEDSLSVPEDSSLYTSLYTSVSGFDDQRSTYPSSPSLPIIHHQGVSNPMDHSSLQVAPTDLPTPSTPNVTGSPTCPLCRKTFSNPNIMWQHINRVHCTQSTFPLPSFYVTYNCLICSQATCRWASHTWFHHSGCQRPLSNGICGQPLSDPTTISLPPPHPSPPPSPPPPPPPLLTALSYQFTPPWSP